MVEIKKGLGRRTLVSTFAGRTTPPHDQNLQKSFQVPAQEKRNLKKCPTARQKTMKNGATNKPTNHGRQRSTGGNSVYVAIAGEVVSRRSVLLKYFVLNGQESASNPLLHIHANRYAALYDDRTELIIQNK